MNIPNFIDTPMVDKEGRLTDKWKETLMQLFSQLQSNVSDQTGIIVPQQPSTNISVMESTDTTGSLVYDKTTNELKVNINGTYKIVQVL